MILTDEQIQIIESTHDNIVVKAGAGAAKTTTLVEYAKANSQKRMLYLAFNKSIKEEAMRKFPSNVTVMTSHSPAYRAIGRSYEHKLAGSLRPYAIMKALNLSRRCKINPTMHMAFAQRIAQTVERFLTTTEPEVTMEDVVIDPASPMERINFPLHDLRQFAAEAWEIMRDVKDDRLPMVHDGYLKLFMLSGQAIGRYDVILFDEAQDSNPVTMRIIENQRAKKIFVGDQNQSIYKFRGAVNAMDMITDAKHYRLSGSFRFGDTIALAANKILYLKDSDLYVKGLGQDGLVILPEKDYVINDQYMNISRGVFTMLEDALKVVEQKKTVHFVGGADGYRFSRLDDVYAMKFAGEVKDPFLKMFESYEALVSYGEADREMGSCIRLVETHGRELPQKLANIKNLTENDYTKANVIFSTAHKAKGLEHDVVKLSEDFSKAFSLANHYDVMGKRLSYHETEEMNIAYVAITRAKRHLVLPPVARPMFQSDQLTTDTIAQQAIVMGREMTMSVGEHKARRRRRAL